MWRAVVSELAGGLGRRAADWRLDFNRSFAAARQTEIAQMVDLLAIRVGTEACALRLSAISGLYADKKITNVPGGTAALIGIAGFRGTILPVYSLRGLLGRARSVAEASRWLVVAADAPVAVAFEGFECHLRIAGEAVLQQEAGEPLGYAREYAHALGHFRPIIDLPSAFSLISHIRGPEASPRKEP
jgi:chemotaxis signal transduction protein